MGWSEGVLRQVVFTNGHLNLINFKWYFLLVALYPLLTNVLLSHGTRHRVIIMDSQKPLQSPIIISSVSHHFPLAWGRFQHSAICVQRTEPFFTPHFMDSPFLILRKVEGVASSWDFWILWFKSHCFSVSSPQLHCLGIYYDSCYVTVASVWTRG